MSDATKNDMLFVAQGSVRDADTNIERAIDVHRGRLTRIF
jgi:hypothetical protein